MNPDSPQTPQEELELRLTALLLGELPDEEAAAWRAAITTNPDLARLHDRLKQTISFVREATAKVTEPVSEQATPVKLSEERREKLLAHFKTVKLREFAPAKRRVASWLVPMAATAVLILLLAAIAIPNFTRARSSSQANAVINNLRQLDSAKQRWALEHGKASSEVPTFDDIKDYMKGQLPPSVTGETYVLGKVGEPVLAEVDASVAKRRLSRLPVAQTRQNAGEPRVRLSAGNDTAYAVEEAAKTTLGFRTWGSERAGAASAESGGNALFDLAVPKAGKPISTQERREPTAHFANAPTSKPDRAAPEVESVPPPPSTVAAHALIVLPAEVESLGANEVGKVAEKQDSERDNLSLGVRGESEGKKGVTTWAADDGNQRLLNERYAIAPQRSQQVVPGTPPPDPGPGMAENRVQISGQLERFYRDLNRTPPATTPTAAGATIAINGVEQPSFAGRGISPATGLPVDSFSPDGAALGQALTVTRAGPAARSYGLGLEPAKQESGARGGTGGGGAGGALSAGGVPVAVQSAPRRVAAGELVAGYAIAPTPALQPSKPQADVPLPVGAVTVESSGNNVPVLGDVPAVRMLYRNNGSGIFEKSTSSGISANTPELPLVRGEESLRRRPPSIVLPSVQTETAEAKEKASEVNKQVQDGKVLIETAKLADAGVRLRETTWGDYDNDGFFDIFGNARGKDTKAGNVGDEQAQLKFRQLTEAQRRPEARKGQVAALEPEVRATQKKVNDLRREFEISDLDAAGSASAPTPEAESMHRSQGQLAASETFLAREKTQLKKQSNVELADLAVRKPATNAPIPQAEIQTSENAFSTFSLNVSDVSFKLAAASLEKGQMPDAASVRGEEFINAFDYRDPEPSPGAPIAFAWERARYPFAHNRDLLRFSLMTAAAGRQAGRPLNIVLLLDNSGSMERADRVRIIREALRVLASQLQPQDKLSVITFARTARLVADGISGDKAGEVTEAVSGVTPQGGTNFEEGMNLAYATALRHYLAGGINRVVLLTDGAANLGDVEPESLKQKVETHRKQGVALDCFGIGWEGFNDDLLEVLSRNGDGRYGFINSPEEAATDFAGQLAGALKVAASDVKVQVEFNPKRVTMYRQIGYAKHQLTKEQFRDNTVDAAEIAAQEAGNALYTAEVNPAGEGPLCTMRVRYKIPGTTDYREQAWDVPFTGNVLSLEQSSPAMRLAASASAFSEWLAASPFAAEVTLDRVLGYLSGVPEVYGADARPKKLEWMIRQAKSVGGN